MNRDIVSEYSYGNVEIVDNEYQQVKFHGHIVPNLNVHLTSDDNGKELIGLFVGDVGITVTEEELPKMIWFVANAMARAAGYTSFSEHSKEYNPYKSPKVV